MAFFVPCDYGICNIEDWNWNRQPLDYSRITIIQPNSYLVILDNIQATSFPTGERTKEDFQEIADTLIGSQWRNVSIYQGTVGGNPNTRYGVFNSGTYWLPSADVYTPDLNRLQISNHVIAIVFNNGETVIVSAPGYGGDGETMLFKKTADGFYTLQIKALSYNGNKFGTGAITQHVMIPTYNGKYTPGDDLTTGEFGVFDVWTNLTSKRSQGLYPVTQTATNFYRLLFSSVTPVTPKDLTTCVITVQPYTNDYTGEAITPEITVVSIDPQTGTYNYLSENGDYTLTFTDNINPGTASVTITGLRLWSGSVTKQFEIVSTTKYPITDCGVVLNPTTFTYDGTAKIPNVTVTRLDTSTTPPTVITLIINRDYTLDYINNIEISNHAQVKIIGIGSYSGERTETFRIVSSAQDVTNWDVDYDKGPYKYTGSPIEVGYVGVMTPDYRILVKDEDYTITYYNNINIGEAYFIVQGIGYYSGTKKCSFYIVTNPENPYLPGGTSESGGGGGTFTHSSGSIPIGSQPTASASNCGMTTIFIPTLSQLRDLAAYLWQDTTPLQTLWNHAKQILENPLDAIISLMVIPLSQSQIGVSGSKEFKVLFIGTGVNMNIAEKQFIRVDCGGVTLQEFFGSCLDYSPYTKISLFLPFVGYVDISPDEIMKKRLEVSYKIDIETGAFVAYVTVGGSVYYQYPGNMSTYIPVTAANFSRYFSAFTMMSSGAVGAISSGLVGGLAGLMAPQAISAPSQQTSPLDSIINNLPASPTLSLPSSGGDIAVRTSVANPFPSPPPAKSSPASFKGQEPKENNNIISAVMASKRVTGSSGSFSASTAFLGSHRCYLIVTRPRQCLPEDYAHLHGFPCMQTLPLSQLTGYTEVQNCDLVNCPATNPEQAEILQLLKSGVIL